MLLYLCTTPLTLLQVAPPIHPDLTTGGYAGGGVLLAIALVKVLEVLIKRLRKNEPASPPAGDLACAERVETHLGAVATQVGALVTAMTEFLHAQELRDVKSEEARRANTAILASQEKLIEKLGDLLGELRRRDV